MQNYCLKDTSKESLEIKLAQAGLGSIVKNTNNEDVFIPSMNFHIDHIGTYTILEVKDELGNIIVPFYEDLNWHANLLLTFELTEEQKAIIPIIDPEPMNRIRNYI